MAQIIQAKINWTGFVGAPGYTNLFFRDFSGGTVDQAMADGAVSKIAAFVTAVKPYLPSNVSLGIDTTFNVLEETTGELQGFLNGGSNTPNPGTGTGTYSAASGACITWTTTGVRNGRRIRGRTFLVPLVGTAYDSDGTLAPGARTALVNAATALSSPTGAGDLGVWARPTAPGATDGIWTVVSASSVRDKVAILTSRRD